MDRAVFGADAGRPPPGNLCRAHVFPKRSPLSACPQVMRVADNPALAILPMTRWGGVLVWGKRIKKDWGWKWQ